MATYSLSGSGQHAVTAGTTALHVTITTLPAGLPAGRASPTNHFDVGLLRAGDGSAYVAPVPIVGGPQWIGIPVGTTTLGYSLLNGAVISVNEIIGGVSPDPVIVLPTAGLLLPPFSISVWSECALGVELAARGSTAFSGGVYPGANIAVLFPFQIQVTTTFTSAWVLNGTTTVGNLDIGIYDRSLTLLFHTGSFVMAGASNPQNTSISWILPPGLYWMALSASNASATFSTLSASSTGAWRLMGAFQAASAFPLPAGPLSRSVPSFSAIPMFGIAQAAL